MSEGRHATVNLPRGAAYAAAAIAAGLLWKVMRTPRFSFRNKSVLVTGGSRGLGLELARLLAEEGASLAIVGRTPSTLDAAKAELEKWGAPVATIPCDVRNRDEVEATVRETVDQFGKIDILINNAGIIQVGPFDVFDWRQAWCAAPAAIRVEQVCAGRSFGSSECRACPG